MEVMQFISTLEILLLLLLLLFVVVLVGNSSFSCRNTNSCNMSASNNTLILLRGTAEVLVEILLTIRVIKNSIVQEDIMLLLVTTIVLKYDNV